MISLRRIVFAAVVAALVLSLIYFVRRWGEIRASIGALSGVWFASRDTFCDKAEIDSVLLCLEAQSDGFDLLPRLEGVVSVSPGSGPARFELCPEFGAALFGGGKLGFWAGVESAEGDAGAEGGAGPFYPPRVFVEANSMRLRISDEQGVVWSDLWRRGDLGRNSDDAAFGRVGRR